MALCQHFTTTTFVKCAFRCTALLSVVTLLQFQVYAKDIPLFPGFLFFLCSLTRCPAPAPLKLRSYGAIQICYYYYCCYNFPAIAETFSVSVHQSYPVCWDLQRLQRIGHLKIYWLIDWNGCHEGIHPFVHVAQNAPRHRQPGVEIRYQVFYRVTS